MRSVPDETTAGSAEECRRDAEQYAHDAAVQLEEAGAALLALGQAIGEGTLEAPSSDAMVTTALVTTLGAHTSAVLGLSARLGQVAAVLAERDR